MSEYYDLKKKVFKITESVIEHENRTEAEADIVSELYKIFRGK